MIWDKRNGTWNWERETTRLTTVYLWDIRLPILSTRFFCLCISWESLHILDTNPLARYRYYLCLLHSACLFSSSDAFEDQKILFFMSSSVSIFPLIASAFGVFLKNIWLPQGYEDLLCYPIDGVLLRLNPHM